MKRERIELVRGTGNVFRDLGDASPDVAQLKAILAAEIIKMLDDKQLSVRRAHAQTGIAAADFSRIRNASSRPSAGTARLACTAQASAKPRCSCPLSSASPARARPRW